MDVGSVKLRTRQGRQRTVDDLTTLFDLCLVAVDLRRPSSYARLLPVVERIDNVLSGADCTVGVLLVGGEEGDAETALGPLARQVAVFADPDAEAARGLGLSGTPALLWITTAPDIGAVVEGWEPLAWRKVFDQLARKLAWARPLVPAPGDPPSFPARPFGPGARAGLAG
ncbi:MAG TPA: hypothetical protein VHG90_06950 [Acidimicrobiales bacterium]|nr:hypothetical protein [Acidimicrobiales bacterium]